MGSESDFSTFYEFIKDDVAVLTLNDPKALTAISNQMNLEIKDALDVVARNDSGTRRLVINGAGRGFCAGANFTDVPRENKLGPRERHIDDWLTLFLRVRDLPIPYISAVKGPVVGVGMSLALSDDMVLAGKSAHFLQALARIGLAPDGGATDILPRLIGKARAMELGKAAPRKKRMTGAW